MRTANLLSTDTPAIGYYMTRNVDTWCSYDVTTGHTIDPVRHEFHAFSDVTTATASGQSATEQSHNPGLNTPDLMDGTDIHRDTPDTDNMISLVGLDEGDLDHRAGDRHHVSTQTRVRGSSPSSSSLLTPPTQVSSVLGGV